MTTTDRAPLDLDAIEARMAAHPGPFMLVKVNGIPASLRGPEGSVVLHGSLRDAEWLTAVAGYLYDFPALIAEVRRLRAHVDYLEHKVDHLELGL